MGSDFDPRERETEREFTELALRLPGLSPQRACLERVKAAVDEEARRLRVRRRRLVALRPWVAAAAAVLLAVGLDPPGGSDSTGLPPDPARNPDAILADWVDALGESGEQFARLLDESWLSIGLGFGPGGDVDNEGPDPLDSLEESLESFERMLEV